MPDNGRDTAGQFTPGHSFAASGGQTAQANRMDELERETCDVPMLEDFPSGKKICAAVSKLAMRGKLSGSQAAAAVRAVEIFLKVHDAKMDRAHLTALEARLAELEQELAAARRGR